MTIIGYSVANGNGVTDSALSSDSEEGLVFKKCSSSMSMKRFFSLRKNTKKRRKNSMESMDSASCTTSSSSSNFEDINNNNYKIRTSSDWNTPLEPLKEEDIDERRERRQSKIRPEVKEYMARLRDERRKKMEEQQRAEKHAESQKLESPRRESSLRRLQRSLSARFLGNGESKKKRESVKKPDGDGGIRFHIGSTKKSQLERSQSCMTPRDCAGVGGCRQQKNGLRGMERKARKPRVKYSVEKNHDDDGDQIHEEIHEEHQEEIHDEDHAHLHIISSNDVIVQRPTALTAPSAVPLTACMTESPEALSSDGNLTRCIPTSPPSAPSSTGSISSEGVDCDKKSHEENSEGRRQFAKKKYFSERAPRKNIFKKYFHPSFHQRSVQFKKIFSGTVDDEDTLLYTFSCAFQREILAQGRLFISQRNVSFYANILGWETLFSIPIKEIAAIKKERAAKIFPNSIQIDTNNGDHFFFASFVNREKTYTVLETVWNNMREDKVISPEDLWEIMNPEEEEHKFPNNKIKKAQSTDNMNKHHSAPVLDLPLSKPDTEFPASEAMDTASTGTGDSSNCETFCPCEDHPGRQLIDKVFTLPVDTLFTLLFTNTPWYKRFNDRLKNTAHAKISENVSGYVASEWATDKDGVKQRTCTYTIALNHAMAPKSCVVTEKQICNHYGGPGDCFVVKKETHNSGVPYSDSFTVQCTYCVTRVNANESRLRVHGGIVYRKSIWGVIKTYIEKNTQQGLDDHYAALVHTVDEEVRNREQEEERSEIEKPEEAGTSEPPLYNTVSANRVRTSSVMSPSTSVAYGESLNLHAQRIEHYMKIIIVMLLLLCLIGVLLLWNMPSSGSPSDSNQWTLQQLREQQRALDSLMQAVSKMSTDIDGLRSNTDKQEL